MDNTITETNKSLAGVVLDEKSSEVDSTKVVSFEKEAKKLQKNKELVKAIMKNKKVQEVVKICWQERVERIFREMLKDEEMMNDISELFANENVKNTLESIVDELNQELAEQYRWEYVKDIIDRVLEQRIDLLKFFGQFKDSDLQKTLKEWDEKKVMGEINDKKDMFDWFLIGFAALIFLGGYVANDKIEHDFYIEWEKLKSQKKIKKHFKKKSKKSYRKKSKKFYREML